MLFCALSCAFFANLCEKKTVTWQKQQAASTEVDAMFTYVFIMLLDLDKFQPTIWLNNGIMNNAVQKGQTKHIPPKKNTMYFTWELLSVNSKEQYAFQKVETSEEHRQQCVETCVDHSTSCFRASAKRRMGSRPSCPASAKSGGQ